MSNFPQLNGELAGNSLGKLNGHVTATKDFGNGFTGSAKMNMNEGKPSLGGWLDSF